MISEIKTQTNTKDAKFTLMMKREREKKAANPQIREVRTEKYSVFLS